MKEPLVSIIVPIYKVPEQYLRKCIESIMAQTLKEIEILLVDDGSPDNCGEICDSYVQKDFRIKVLHKENGGVCSARNAGLEMANGMYVSFLDGDDWIENDTLEYALSKLIETSSDMVSWNHYYNKEENFDLSIPRTAMPQNEIIYDEKDIQERLIYDFITPEYDVRKYNTNLGAVRGVWGKIYKLEIIKRNHLRFDLQLKIGEDACFNIDYIRKTKAVLFINKYFSHYRITSYSANHRARKDIIDVRISLLKKYRSLFDKSDDVFWLCYAREVVSCVINCLDKYFCVDLNLYKLNTRINELKVLLNNDNICCLDENKLRCQASFFKVSERILLRMILFKRPISLLVIGVITRMIKKLRSN